jgi:hypothetical protein
MNDNKKQKLNSEIEKKHDRDNEDDTYSLIFIKEHLFLVPDEEITPYIRHALDIANLMQDDENIETAIECIPNTTEQVIEVLKTVIKVDELNKEILKSIADEFEKGIFNESTMSDYSKYFFFKAACCFSIELRKNMNVFVFNETNVVNLFKYEVESYKSINKKVSYFYTFNY